MGTGLTIVGKNMMAGTTRALATCILAMLFSGLSDLAIAQKCTVIDPELQGQYSGGCLAGLAEGYGEAEGIARYKGSFHSGKKSGAGLKTWPWGDQYRGEFLDDAMEGEGHFVRQSTDLRSGEEYIGHFVSNRREGFGEYRWSTGEILPGLWQADMPSTKVDPDLFGRLAAQLRADVDSEVAVARSGVRVCRQIKIGISELEWIRGVVIAVRSRAISVEVEMPSSNPQSLNGIDLKKGAILWDLARNWKPCL